MTTSSTYPLSSADGVLSLGASAVRAFWSGRAQGDQREVGDGRLPSPVPAHLSARRLTQVHGSGVRIVGPHDLRQSSVGDALVSRRADVCLVVLTADCAAVALASPEGVFGAVHAGWRGLVAGVIEEAIAAMRGQGASSVEAAIGPTVHPCCYEFSPPDLAVVADRYGSGVRSATSTGAVALNLSATVRAALEGADAQCVAEPFGCTSCETGWYSHRREGSPARQGLFVWRAEAV